MIEKFISIKNIGRFRNFNTRGDVTLRKMNLIFAENGRGKTTLCAILRSLQSGKPEYISERKTLGTTEPAYVQMRIDGQNITFQSNAWSRNHPDIAIFDSVFVHENVYAGDYVDHEHKKNLYRVIVGAYGVQLAKQIEELDGKIREANKNINGKKETVAKAIPSGISLETFLAWQPDDEIETKILQKNAEIANRQRTLEKANEIQSKSLLSKIVLPDIPHAFLATLSKKLDDIAADAEAQLRKQVFKHRMGKEGETWLSQGLGFVSEETCPFCGQGVKGNELLAAYRSYFSNAYKALKQEVSQLSERINEAIGESVLSALQTTISGNVALIEFWKQFDKVDLPELGFEDIRSAYLSLREHALALAQRKQQNPTDPVDPGIDYQTALNAVTVLRAAVEAYNAAVQAANTVINIQKSTAKQGLDINTIRQELVVLEAKKKRFESNLKEACIAYQVSLMEKEALDQQKARVREQLDQYCQQIIHTYQSSINTYLDQFNAEFRIANSRHLYTGGTPSSHYHITINDCAVDVGDSRTPFGTPCFKTTLSSGDRSALALAFFLASLSQDSAIGNKIVVFDDPFTSQDRFRRTCTQQLICHIGRVAKQVIVLSHDPQFLRLIEEGYPATDIKVLQMCRAGETTIIGELDIVAETQSTYLKNYSTLLTFYRERKGELLAVARAIRPFLEGLLRAHFPGHFQQEEWLGQFIDKIRNADDSSGLAHAKADVGEIEAINNYSKRYHHEQNASAGAEPISEDELHGFVKRTLRLAGGC